VFSEPRLIPAYQVYVEMCACVPIKSGVHVHITYIHVCIYVKCAYSVHACMHVCGNVRACMNKSTTTVHVLSESRFTGVYWLDMYEYVCVCMS
jgi:hypothetical protein